MITGQPLPRPAYLASGESPVVVPLPDELSGSEALFEGARYQITVNAYERDPEARRRCIEKQGTRCVICGFSFAAQYGDVAADFIHVHHVRPLAEIGKEYCIDPDVDLRPVCPNCHAVVHRRTPPYSIEEVRIFLQDRAHPN